MAKKHTKKKVAKNSQTVKEIPSELIERAKKLGVSDEQIKALDSVENIKAFCDQISPQTNPDSLPKKGEIKAPVKREPEKLPDGFEANRDELRSDKQSIESVVRKLNIKYNTPDFKRIVKTIVYDCESKTVSSSYVIEK